jgi:hypothetical protein
VLPAGEARRLDSGPTAEAGDLQPGVLAEDPVLLVDPSAELGLGAGVLVVRRPRLRWIVVRCERLELAVLEGAT